MTIHQLIRKIKNAILRKKDQKLYASGADTLINNVFIQVRNGLRNPERCIFGTRSTISGNFVLETADAKIKVGDRTFIGGGQFIATTEIEIGSDVLISWGCTFIDTNAHSLSWQERKRDVEEWRQGLLENKIGIYKDWSNVHSKKISVCDKSWIGFNCIILKGVTIGEGAVVGAGSIVTSDVPPYTVYAGNPAKFVKEIERN